MKNLTRLFSVCALTALSTGVCFAQAAPTITPTEIVDVGGTVPLWIAALVAVIPIVLAFKMGVRLANKMLAMLFSGGAKVKA